MFAGYHSKINQKTAQNRKKIKKIGKMVRSEW
jgi:hypothetical protein